jgi:hypothetical protein
MTSAMSHSAGSIGQILELYDLKEQAEQPIKKSFIGDFPYIIPVPVYKI